MVDSEMRIIPEVLDFTRYLEQKGMKTNTIETYLSKLCAFYEWMELSGLKAFEVMPSHMPDFIQYIDNKYAKTGKGKKLAPSTLNGYLAALATFYKYFGLMGFVEPADYKINDKKQVRHLSYLKHVNKRWDVSIFSVFSRKKRKRVDRKRLSDDEANIFYKAIGDVSEEESLRVRNQLIFKILFETGMRIGELLHLRIDDYDLPDPFNKVGNIYLIEKGRTDDKDRELKTGERTIVVSRELLEQIEEYVIYHRPQVNGCKYIIVNHRTLPGTATGRGAIEEMFRKAYEASGIKRKIITPHSLRHTHASNMQSMGIDISIIKARLGHQSIATTSGYIEVSLETLTHSYSNYLENTKNNRGILE